VDACVAAGDAVTGVARRARRRDDAAFRAVDLLDGPSVKSLVKAVEPDVVYHLAALASVGRSWRDPAPSLQSNMAMTLNVLEAVRTGAPDARVMIASSGEIYGPPEKLPVDESPGFRPQNPYAVSKASADLLAGFYADAHGLAVVRARAFNHAGPRQSTDYAIASFARQTAAGRMAGDSPIRIVTGNPDARRDFTDVRDVVRAYRMMVDAEPGAYNVCSGTSVSVRELVALLGEVAGVEVEHVVDDALRRPHEVPEVRGSAERLHAATGWTPEIPLRTTLADTVAWWEEQLATATR
jgi:GDP-4-dehydro-6-deoxy-D-mannose reductase